MIDPRVELVQAILNIAEADIYVEDASDALVSLDREVQLARAVVEAIEELPDEEWWHEVSKASAAYRAEFPQEPTA